MASQLDILQSCLQEVVKTTQPALERCIDEAVNALQTAEAQSKKMTERDTLGTAWRELLKLKPAWGARYRADLLLLFNASASAPLAPQSLAERPRGFLSHTDFSLVDDAEVSRAIESSRLLQQVLPMVESVLGELDTLVSTLQGLSSVQPELNPLRPEVFTKALRNMVLDTPVEPAIASLWIKHLAPSLGRELKQIYQGLVGRLEGSNVQAAGYRMRQAAGATRQAAHSKADEIDAPATEGNEPSSGDAANLLPDSIYSNFINKSHPGIQDASFQGFLRHGSSEQHSLTQAYYATVEAELATLQATPHSAFEPLSQSLYAAPSGYESMPAVDRPQRFVDERISLSQEVWGAYARPKERALVRTQLKKEAQRVEQVMGLEVVRKLANQVAQDSRLLAPVREAIVALEPSLLRLAMVDPRFFSDEAHAGRLLMERVAQRSFNYNDEFSPEFLDFFEPVSNAFNGLNTQEIKDAQPFCEALETLEAGWNALDQLQAASRKKLIDTLHFAQERHALAELIAFEMGSRDDLENAPNLVLDFLFGPWSLVMAHVRLTDTQAYTDPLGVSAVISELLWSVKREVMLKSPRKLIEMIPGLLLKLQSGLNLLGQSPQESQAFFDGLMDLHQPVLKLRRHKSAHEAQNPDVAPLTDVAPSPTLEPLTARAYPWMGAGEMDIAGFEDTSCGLPLENMASISKTPQEIGAPKPQPSPALNNAEQATHTETSEQAKQLLLALQKGHWVDIYSQQGWLRAQLIWTSAKNTLFMFLSPGGQPHSMTQRRCEQLIQNRLLRPVDAQGVVAQALEAMASQVTTSAKRHLATS